MNNDVIIFSGGITLTIFATFAAVRWLRLPAILAGVIMAIAPVLLMWIIVRTQGGDIYWVYCSPLLSFASGPTAYVWGRIIERKAKERQQ